MTTEEKRGSYLPSGKVTTEKKDKERDIFPAVNSIVVPDGGRRKSQYNQRVFASLCILVFKCYLQLSSFCKDKRCHKEANKLKLCCHKSRLLSAYLNFHDVSDPHTARVTHEILSFFLNMPTVIIAPGRELETCTRK